MNTNFLRIYGFFDYILFDLLSYLEKSKSKSYNISNIYFFLSENLFYFSFLIIIIFLHFYKKQTEKNFFSTKSTKIFNKLTYFILNILIMIDKKYFSTYTSEMINLVFFICLYNNLKKNLKK